MIKKIVTRAINLVTEPVTEEVRLARLDKCNLCDQKTTSHPLPGMTVDTCGVCYCPIETLTASKRHPEMFEGKLSGKMIKTKCKHPKGSKWLGMIALVFLTLSGYSQGFDENYLEERSEITDIDSVGLWNMIGEDFYRYSGKALKKYMAALDSAIVADSSFAIRSDFPVFDSTGFVWQEYLVPIQPNLGQTTITVPNLPDSIQDRNIELYRNTDIWYVGGTGTYFQRIDSNVFTIYRPIDATEKLIVMWRSDGLSSQSTGTADGFSPDPISIDSTLYADGSKRYDLSTPSNTAARSIYTPVSVGPVGQDGTDGATGPQGPAGPAGNDGADGQDGADGATGPQGPAGPAGNDGADGADGQDANAVTLESCATSNNQTTFTYTYSGSTNPTASEIKVRRNASFWEHDPFASQFNWTQSTMTLTLSNARRPVLDGECYYIVFSE